MMVVASLVSFIATWIGTPESAIRLLLSLFAGYPLAWLYRVHVIKKPAYLQHLFFTFCGLVIAYFNFGVSVQHSLFIILINYGILLVAPGTQLSVAVAFFINTLYLMIGYYLVETDEYQIMWTMPQCVLTLRLTSTVFDVYDGRRKKSGKQLSSEQETTALEDVPSLLEMFGHSFLFGGYIIGPQFSMKRYRTFIDGGFLAENGDPPPSMVPGLKRLGLGLLYVCLFQTGNILVTNEFLLSPGFEESNFLARCAYVLIWGKLVIMKYVGAWLLTEGSIIITGLSHNGVDENGVLKWDGCTNVNIYRLESAVTFHQMIQSFNMNTNMWMSKYVFKRLRFLGNKFISQGVTLAYLAIWHGLQTGYYNCFMLEFFMTNCETQVIAVLKKMPALERFTKNSYVRPVLWLSMKIFTTFSLSYALVGFGLLSFHRYHKVYSSIYYLCHCVFLGWPVLNFLLNTFVLPKKALINGVPNTHRSDEKES